MALNDFYLTIKIVLEFFIILLALELFLIKTKNRIRAVVFEILTEFFIFIRQIFEDLCKIACGGLY